METVDITFNADAEAIVAALDVISIVEPPGVTEQGLSGYLFVVGKKVDKKDDGQGNVVVGPDDGKDFCWVYSRDALRAARAEFPIRELQGEGAFVYPSAHVNTFKHVRGEMTFNVHSETDGQNFNGLVKWGFGAGAGTERPLIDHRLLSALDKRLNESTNHHTFKTALLKEALKGGKPFLAGDSDRNAKDEYKIVNIYDPTMDKSGKGDGTLFATDAYQRFYFQCEDFKGKGLQIHSDQIGKLESFLAKCGQEVILCTGTDMTYAMSTDKTKVFGWTRHTKPALDYKALPKSWDRVVLMVKDRDMLVQQLNFIKAEMEKGRDKIEIEYTAESRQIRFRIKAGGKTTSLPIDIEVPKDPEGKEVETRSYKHDVNVDQLLSLFKDVRAAVVEFRMFLMEEHGGPKGGAGFRTIDEYWLDPDGKVVGGSNMTPDPANGQVFQCKVTRFMPSKM